MLNNIDENPVINKIETAIAKVIEKGEKVTKDINKNNFVTTEQFAEAVIEEMEK